MWCMVSIHEVQRVYMRYRHTAQLVLSICILYGCYTWGTVGIYEIQLVCIMCMGLNMRYSGHKRVKNISIKLIHLAPPQLLLKVLVYLTLIRFSRKYSFLKYTHISTSTWRGILKYSTMKKSPPPPRPDPPRDQILIHRYHI